MTQLSGLKVGDTVYRYEPGHWQFNRRLPQEPYCYKYKVVKVTPCGVWVSMGWNDKKWFSTNRPYGLMWAYPTKELAMESYIARTNRRISIVAYQIHKAISDLEVVSGREKADEAKERVRHIMASGRRRQMLDWG